MPSVAVKLYSVFFKFLLKHRLHNRIQTTTDNSDPFGVTTSPEESVAAANPSFSDGVATKDIHIDPLTSLSIRIFLPESALKPPDPHSKTNLPPKPRTNPISSKPDPEPGSPSLDLIPRRRNSFGPPLREELRSNSFCASNGVEGLNLMSAGVYRGYSPALGNQRKLPVMLQFHGGGWVSGSNDSIANDGWRSRRIWQSVANPWGFERLEATVVVSLRNLMHLSSPKDYIYPKPKPKTMHTCTSREEEWCFPPKYFLSLIFGNCCSRGHGLF